MSDTNDPVEVDKPRILYLDMAYTYSMVKTRKLEQEILSRECGGYFDHVWGVHPLSNLPEDRPLKYEGFKIKEFLFSKKQTLLEGETAYYPLLRFLFPLNFLISQIRFTIFLIRLVKRNRISIVMCTEPHFTGLVGLAIKIFTPSKLVIWVVAHYDDLYQATGVPAMPRLYKWRWVEKLIEKLVFTSADLVAGANQNNLEFALKNGAKSKKSTVFSNGKLIHPSHLTDPALRDKYKIFIDSKAKYHFIYVGRLSLVKHPDDVLRAFAIINANVSNCALIMAGDGPMKSELIDLAKALGIDEKVLFLGNINQLELGSLLAGCFAVLSPLTGRSLMEGALAGLPIVAYDRDWQMEFVGKKGAGIVVPFRDFEQMASAALRLIHNPEEAKRMSYAARNAGVETCDTEKLYAHEGNEFDKLLKRT